METKEKIISGYFKAWLENNATTLKDVFDTNAYYSESWGPEYNGLDEITKWFSDWNITGKVADWTIKQYIHDGDKVAAEWHFRAEYNNGKVPDDFDGVSLIVFNQDNKIVILKEFASKLPRYRVY